MSWKKWLCIAGLVVTAGCEIQACQRYGNNYHIVIDPKFSPLEVSVIHSAIDQWIMKLQDKGINLGIDYLGQAECEAGEKEEGKICIHYSNSLQMIELGLESSTGGSVAITTRFVNDSSDIWIDMDEWTGNSPLECFSHNIQHEMGHAFGLLHTETGVMFWWYNLNPDPRASFDVNEVDVEQYLWWRHLSNQTPDFYH